MAENHIMCVSKLLYKGDSALPTNTELKKIIYLTLLNNIILLLIVVITFCLVLGDLAEVNFKKCPLKLKGCCLMYENKIG